MAGGLDSHALPDAGRPVECSRLGVLLAAASIEQARLCYRFTRDALEPTGDYRFLDSAMRIGVTHKPTKTRLRVLSSNAKTAFGIVGCPLLVADEPGSWNTLGGTLMHDAIATSAGKPGSPMRTVYIGTLAQLRRARSPGASNPAPRLPGEGRGGCPGSPGVRRD